MPKKNLSKGLENIGYLTRELKYRMIIQISKDLELNEEEMLEKYMNDIKYIEIKNK
jgi:hypothetical protein